MFLRKGVTFVKSHKYWALAAAFCMLMAIYTGYQHE